MVFKLVRIDTPEPCKIQLTIGKHVIGRGKFLHNDEADKRVSRNHAELEVTLDTVKLKSLHQNPCFFMKKSIETHLLHQDSMVCLCHGDKFGLLPDHFWYEVIHCPDQDSIEERQTISETTDNGVHSDEEDMNQTEGVKEQGNSSSENSTASEQGKETSNSEYSQEDFGPNMWGSSEDPFGLMPNYLYRALNQCDVVTTETATTTDGSVIRTHTFSYSDKAKKELGIKGRDGTRDPGNGSSKTGDDAKEEERINFDDGVEEGDSRSASPSLLNAEEEAATQVITDQATEEQVTEPANPVTEKSETVDQVTEPADTVTVKSETVDQDTEPYDLPDPLPTANAARTPVKREHSSTESSPVDVKKVKIEPVDAAAGPSNGQQASSDSDSKDTAAPASPAKPAPAPRERCIYGANCYRRNPQHKAQFSHPSDADWGTEARGVCPYAGACRRRDPRHWDTHTHPPGTTPPAHGPRPGNRQRRRQVRPRNVSVSDDDDLSDSPARNLIVTGKRARKTVDRQGQDWSDDAESDEDRDPYGTDESDEWQPPSDVTNSQDFSQDL